MFCKYEILMLCRYSAVVWWFLFVGLMGVLLASVVVYGRASQTSLNMRERAKHHQIIYTLVSWTSGLNVDLDSFGFYKKVGVNSDSGAVVGPPGGSVGRGWTSQKRPREYLTRGDDSLVFELIEQNKTNFCLSMFCCKTPKPKDELRKIDWLLVSLFGIFFIFRLPSRTQPSSLLNEFICIILLLYK